MPSYILKLYRNGGSASREVASFVIDALDNESAIEKAPRTRLSVENIALAMLMGSDGTPIWVGSELTGFTF